MQIVMGGLSWWHWIIILGAFVLLFGAKKLPDAARGVGRSLRILKSEVSAMSDDDKARTEETAGVGPVVLTAPTPVVPAVLSPAAVLPTDPATAGVAPASSVPAGRS